MKYRYFTQGTRDSKEGLTISVSTYDDDDNLVVGIENPLSQYKAKEITEQEYEALQNELANSTVKGLAGGLISEKGKALLEAYHQTIQDNWLKTVKATAKRLSKMGLTSEEIADELKSRYRGLTAAQLKEVIHDA